MIEFSDWIALLALAISAYAVYQTHSSRKTQDQLTHREIELVRQQIEQNRKEDRESRTADVSANLYKVGKSDWRLRIFNRGPAVASNVDFKILKEGGSMFSEDWKNQKLPMKSMEKGSTVEINASVHYGSGPKESIELVWDDPSGKGHRKEVEVTI